MIRSTSFLCDQYVIHHLVKRYEILFTLCMTTHDQHGGNIALFLWCNSPRHHGCILRMHGIIPIRLPWYMLSKRMPLPALRSDEKAAFEIIISYLLNNAHAQIGHVYILMIVPLLVPAHLSGRRLQQNLIICPFLRQQRTRL